MRFITLPNYHSMTETPEEKRLKLSDFWIKIKIFWLLWMLYSTLSHSRPQLQKQFAYEFAGCFRFRFSPDTQNRAFAKKRKLHSYLRYNPGGGGENNFWLKFSGGNYMYLSGWKKYFNIQEKGIPNFNAKRSIYMSVALTDGLVLLRLQGYSMCLATFYKKF